LFSDKTYEAVGDEELRSEHEHGVSGDAGLLNDVVGPGASERQVRGAGPESRMRIFAQDGETFFPPAAILEIEVFDVACDTRIGDGV
jgi:hypothetical protein